MCVCVSVCVCLCVILNVCVSVCLCVCAYPADSVFDFDCMSLCTMCIIATNIQLSELRAKIIEILSKSLDRGAYCSLDDRLKSDVILLSSTLCASLSLCVYAICMKIILSNF